MGLAKIGAEMLNSTFWILMNSCTKFEHWYYAFSHFGKTKAIANQRKINLFGFWKCCLLT
jgi:hypothetical protein